jgi:hypothetical protein
MASLAVASVSLLLSSAPAQAASTETACPATTLTQPFVNWGDAGNYSLVPGGSFEGGEVPWTLSGAASIAAGSEPYAVTGQLGTSSLKLPEGSAAQSPLVCVEPNDRTFRFFVRSEGLFAIVAVRLVYRSTEGNLVLAEKLVLATSTWEPTLIMHTGAARASAISGGSAYLSVSLVARRGAARIDDVYLDPRMRR